MVVVTTAIVAIIIMAIMAILIVAIFVAVVVAIVMAIASLVGKPSSYQIVVTAIIRLPVMSTAPSMAKGTTSIEPAGGAEKPLLQDPRYGYLRHMVGQGGAGCFEVARRQDVKEGV
jgi:hypothetical protein